MRYENYQFNIGMARFVYENAGPSAGPAETAPPPNEKADLAELLGMRTGAHEHAKELLGDHFDLFDTKTEDGRQGLLERLSQAWDKTVDQLVGTLARIFGKSVDKSDIEDFIQSASAEKESEEKDAEEKDPGKVTIKENKEVSKRNWSRAKHAADHLNEHKDWLGFTKRAAEKWHLPVSTLATFIEMESGWNPNSAPVYKDQNGNKISGKFTPDEAKDKGLTLVTSAHGLAQAMRKSVPKYARERYQQFHAESGNSNLPEEPNLYDPETAIDFMGWHLDEIIHGANGIIENPQAHFSSKEIERFGLQPGAFPESYKLTAESDVKWLYMAYNNGGLGYLVLRRYRENKTEENKSKLTWFQQRDYESKGKSLGLEGEVRANYADRVAQVASAFKDFEIS